MLTVSSGTSVANSINAVQFPLLALVFDATVIFLHAKEALLTCRPAGTPLSYTTTGRGLGATTGVTVVRSYLLCWTVDWSRARPTIWRSFSILVSTRRHCA